MYLSELESYKIFEELKKLRLLEPDEALERAKNTDYAYLAVQPEGNEINWADAENFYLEGYNDCLLQISDIIKKAKNKETQR